MSRNLSLIKEKLPDRRIALDNRLEISELYVEQVVESPFAPRACRPQIATSPAEGLAAQSATDRLPVISTLWAGGVAASPA